MTTTTSLTIAKGLRRAKTLEGKVAELARRLAGCTTWVQGKEHAFDFVETLKAHDEAVAELVRIRTSIARANATTELEFEGRRMTLTEGIRCQAELKGRITQFAGFDLSQGTEHVHDGAYDERGRPVYQDVVRVAVWSEPERAAKIEVLRAQLETLNEALETANHLTRLEA